MWWGFGVQTIERPCQGEVSAASSPPAQIPVALMSPTELPPATPYTAVGQWMRWCFEALHMIQGFLPILDLSPISCFLKDALSPYRS